MKFKELHRKLLNEWTVGECTMGFELEAIMDFGKYGELSGVDGDKSMEHLKSTDIWKYLNGLFPGGHIDFESSVGPRNDVHELSQPFEFVSPILPVSPSNLSKLVRMVANLGEYDNTIVDISCGFHLHMSLPKMSDLDMKAIVIAICCDAHILHFMDEQLESAIKPNGENDAEYFADPADAWEVNKLATYIDLDPNEVDEGDIETAVGLIDEVGKVLSTTDKFKALRFHPQGTIEWRTPRNIDAPGVMRETVAVFYNMVSIATRTINTGVIKNGTRYGIPISWLSEHIPSGFDQGSIEFKNNGNRVSHSDNVSRLPIVTSLSELTKFNGGINSVEYNTITSGILEFLDGDIGKYVNGDSTELSSVISDVISILSSEFSDMSMVNHIGETIITNDSLGITYYVKLVDSFVNAGVKMSPLPKYITTELRKLGKRSMVSTVYQAIASTNLDQAEVDRIRTELMTLN